MFQDQNVATASVRGALFSTLVNMFGTCAAAEQSSNVEKNTYTLKVYLLEGLYEAYRLFCCSTLNMNPVGSVAFKVHLTVSPFQLQTHSLSGDRETVFRIKSHK